MAIHLTKEEKAARYDALQSAIRHTKEMYEKRRDSFDKQYKEAQAQGILGAYSKGQSDAFALAADDLSRWIE